MDNNYIGIVYGKMNLTLAKKGDISTKLPSLNNPVPTGNLVYTYGNPFSGVTNKVFGSIRPSISRNSMAEESSESSDSSGSSERRRSLMSMLSNGRFGSTDSNTNGRPNQNEQSYVHPALDETPESPLLPFFLNNKVDIVAEAARLRDEIAYELLFPDGISSRDTLEKFTLLTRLIRVMNLKQIEQLQRYEKNSVPQKNNQDSFEVLRSAVAQAGTGPALLIIEKWIKEGKLQGFTAAQTISIMPKSARLPTSEYIEKFFVSI